ncbi:hypothetical protein EI94DRAFT_1327720 [Lactarius quietus]|nr:hypothetical protein EI94DRAFT_1327720 [Lactarius quietus]
MKSDSKSGLRKYREAREYRKAAQETLKFVKRVIGIDRANDVTLGQTSNLLNPILMDSESSGQITNIHKQLAAEIKPKVATLVEKMYNFKTSQAPARISFNAGRAQELLTNFKFIYPEPQNGRDPYRHPIIQRAIDIVKDDIGVVDHEHSSPMPIPIIATTLTVIEWCIGEWSDARCPASLYQLQWDLFRMTREYSGVSPDPVIGSSRFPPGALNAHSFYFARLFLTSSISCQCYFFHIDRVGCTIAFVACFNCFFYCKLAGS